MAFIKVTHTNGKCWALKTSKTYIACTSLVRKRNPMSVCVHACAWTHTCTHKRCHYVSKSNSNRNAFCFFSHPLNHFSPYYFVYLILLSLFIYLFFFNFLPSILSSFNNYTVHVYVHSMVLEAKRNQQSKMHKLCPQETNTLVQDQINS